MIPKNHLCVKGKHDYLKNISAISTDPAMPGTSGESLDLIFNSQFSIFNECSNLSIFKFEVLLVIGHSELKISRLCYREVYPELVERTRDDRCEGLLNKIMAKSIVML